MKVLLLTEESSDFSKILHSCAVDVEQMTVSQAALKNISSYDAYCVLSSEKVLDARVHYQLEKAAKEGKHVFLEFKSTFTSTCALNCTNTTRSRLIYVESEGCEKIPGLTTGDLLDDENNSMLQTWSAIPEYRPILVYKHHIIAHTHLKETKDEILKDSKCGLWMSGDNLMISSFQLRNFRRARFAPVKSWEKLIKYIIRWITGEEPTFMPEPAVQYGTTEDISEDTVFEQCRKKSVEQGIQWLKNFLVDDGSGGIREGLSHKIAPDGYQTPLNNVRNDCSGEAAGAFGLYAHVFNDDSAKKISENLDNFTYGTMMIKEGLFNGFMRWSDEAWNVCYQDDIARCILSGLYKCLFLNDASLYPEICRSLDAMASLTAKDGCRKSRFDMPNMTADSFVEHREAEFSSRSVHHNSYLLAAFLLAHKYKSNPVYLEIGQKGLETLMEAYPYTELEHSETQEKCRLIFPLAVLYDVTKKEKHREMLYRVVADLEKFRHPFGGYFEWDTEYKAKYSRISTSECSLLTENGDPVADLLYSMNWLPIGFAYAYYATGDEWFNSLWKNIVRFCLKTQLISSDPMLNGSWCRAFDMDLKEVYGCPHDEGWAPYASETGWTVAEILMGMMFMDILPL
ncbi:MAG: hypothetical protein E7477_07135 [Ruminococcaceae bacterium]|nr:hypothetical protein [Oscillospiraceae bacterium]